MQMPNQARLKSLVEKNAPVLLGAFLVYAFVRSVVAGTGTVYLYDELLTRLVTAQAGLKGIMAALRAPLDGQPPLFYVIEQLASRIVENQDIALRLPPAIGVVCTLLCVFVFLRRSGQITALLSVIFLMMTAVFTVYGAEARPYSLVVACIGAALVCYQRAPSARWLVLLGVSLALAESLHYLAVLSIVPFGLAELTESLRTKKVRWGVWAAFAAGATPLALFWGLLILNKAYYGAHHVALGFQLSSIPQVYGDFFGTVSPLGTCISLAVAAGLSIAWLRTRRTAEVEKEGEIREPVLLIGLIGLPFVAYFFALASHSPMASRYLLPGVLGITLGFGYAVARAHKLAVLVCAVFVLSAVGVEELHFWRSVRADQREVKERGSTTAEFLRKAGYGELPVVVPNGYVLWLAHYVSPSAAGRFVYLTQDLSGDRDTPDKSIQVVQQYVPIQVERASEFIGGNAKFLIYIDGQYAPDRWIITRLLKERWTLELVAFDGFRELYLARKGDYQKSRD